jgi:hypothetical protein
MCVNGKEQSLVASIKEAQAQRSAAQRRQAAASKAWNPSDQPEWLDGKKNVL